MGGKDESNAEVRMLIDVVPIWQAKSNPVGGARDDPNHSPYLPPPLGRMSFTLNPLKLFNMLLGPKARAAVKKWFWCATCSILCLGICYYVIPGVIAQILTFWM